MTRTKGAKNKLKIFDADGNLIVKKGKHFNQHTNKNKPKLDLPKDRRKIGVRGFISPEGELCAFCGRPGLVYRQGSTQVLTQKYGLYYRHVNIAQMKQVHFFCTNDCKMQWCYNGAKGASNKQKELIDYV